jgi:hypothetical protein
MTTLAAFLLSITSTITARVLTSLGIGFLAFTAITTLVNSLVGQINAQYGNVTGTVLQLLNLGGVGTSISIITSALVTRATLLAIKQLRVLP